MTALEGHSLHVTSEQLSYGLENGDGTQRCWLNTICTLLYKGKGLPDFWQAQVIAPQAALSKQAKYEEQCKVIYRQFVELHQTLQQGEGSTLGIWCTLGKAYPRMVAQVNRQHLQQDIDEGISLLLPMLVDGMRLSKVPPQVVAAFEGHFSISRADGISCSNPNCSYANLVQQSADIKMAVPVTDSLDSLEAGIAAALSRDTLQDWECKDLEACRDCRAGVRHSEHCRQQGGSKGAVIADHGQLIVFSLNRFKVEDTSYSDYAGYHQQKSLTKVHRAVTFPMQLDITCHCTENLVARNGGLLTLCGVLVHDGATATQGHYYGYLQQASQRWACHNDRSVKDVSQQEVLGLTRLAYLLVYKAVPQYQSLSPTLEEALDTSSLDCINTTAMLPAPSTPSAQEAGALPSSMTSTPEWSSYCAIDRLLPDEPAAVMPSSSILPTASALVSDTSCTDQPMVVISAAPEDQQHDAALDSLLASEPAFTTCSSSAVPQTATMPALDVAATATRQQPVQPGMSAQSSGLKARPSQAAHKRSTDLHKAAMVRLMLQQQKAASKAAADAAAAAVKPASPSKADDSSAVSPPKAAAALAQSASETVTKLAEPVEPAAEDSVPVQSECVNKPQLEAESVAECSSVDHNEAKPVAQVLSKHKRKTAAKQARKKPAATKAQRKSEGRAVPESLSRTAMPTATSGAEAITNQSGPLETVPCLVAEPATLNPSSVVDRRLLMLPSASSCRFCAAEVCNTMADAEALAGPSVGDVICDDGLSIDDEVAQAYATLACALADTDSRALQQLLRPDEAGLAATGHSDHQLEATEQSSAVEAVYEDIPQVQSAQGVVSEADNAASHSHEEEMAASALAGPAALEQMAVQHRAAHDSTAAERAHEMPTESEVVTALTAEQPSAADTAESKAAVQSGMAQQLESCPFASRSQLQETCTQAERLHFSPVMPASPVSPQQSSEQLEEQAVQAQHDPADSVVTGHVQMPTSPATLQADAAAPLHLGAESPSATAAQSSPAPQALVEASGDECQTQSPDLAPVSVDCDGDDCGGGIIMPEALAAPSPAPCSASSAARHKGPAEKEALVRPQGIAGWAYYVAGAVWGTSLGVVKV